MTESVDSSVELASSQTKKEPNNLNGFFETRGVDSYQIIFGKLQLIPSTEVLKNLYGVSQLFFHHDTGLEIANPSILSTYSILIQREGSSAIYLYSNNTKYHIVSAAVLIQYNFWGDPFKIPSVIFKQIPEGEAITLNRLDQ